MTLRFLSRKEIDATGWDQCIEAAPQGLPYAFTWYLDAMCGGKWAALVKGAYEQVLPLPYNQKLLGMSQVYPPLVLQQTGVMGANVDRDVIKKFLKAIPRRFRYVALNLNEGNCLPDMVDFDFSPKTNLLLDLSSKHELLWKGYDKSLRRRLRKARQRLRLEKLHQPELVVATYRDQLEEKLGLGNLTYHQVHRLIEEALARGKGRIYAVYAEETDQLCACGFFLFSHGRIIDLFGASTELGRKEHAMHYLLDQLIMQHAGQKLIFDFEGSEIPAVARFFRSFGSHPALYHLAVRDHRPDWLKRLQYWKNRRSNR